MPVTSSVKLVAVLGATTVLLSAVELRAERVGYRFQGSLIQTGSAGNYTLFGVSVPKTSPVTGTFSYDTTTPGIDVETGVRTYHQYVSGGYTLDINNSAIRLAASDYIITVANDNGANQNDIFSVDYNYDSANGITPERILVNGTAWSGTRSFIKLELSWPGTTFTDPDEPKLTGERPLTPDSAFTAFVGSSATPRFFSLTTISAIVPPAGDYNYDGKLDASDYTEWRKAFGETQPQFHYADGNNNGVVDTADYVVWRNGVGTSGAGAMVESTIPEPTGLMLFVAGLAIVATRLRRIFTPRILN